MDTYQGPFPVGPFLCPVWLQRSIFSFLVHYRQRSQFVGCCCIFLFPWWWPCVPRLFYYWISTLHVAAVSQLFVTFHTSYHVELKGSVVYHTIDTHQVTIDSRTAQPPQPLTHLYTEAWQRQTFDSRCWPSNNCRRIVYTAIVIVVNMKEKFQLTISQWKRRIIITSQVVRVGDDVFCDSISETKNLLPTISRKCRLYTEDIASMATHKDKFLPTRVLVVKLENRSIRLQRASVDIPSSRHVKKGLPFLFCF